MPRPYGTKLRVRRDPVASSAARPAWAALLLALLLVLGLAHRADAQDGGPFVEVELRDDVTPIDPGKPVKGGLAAWVKDGAGPADVAADALALDSQGRARFPFQGPGRTLLVWAPGRAPVAIRVNAPIPFFIVMRPSVTAVIHVTTATGAALPDAEVEVEARLALFHSTSGGPDVHVVRSVARTDGNGDATFSGLGDEALSVVVRAEGYSENVLPPVDPRVGATVVLGRGSRVDGTLRITPGSTVSPVAVARLGPRIARVDAEGRWSFEHVPPGAWTLRFAGAGFSPPRDRTLVLEDGNDRTGIDVTAPATSAFRGRLVPPEDRTAGAARVTFLFPPAAGVEPVVADVTPGPDGRFRVTELLACDGAVVTAEVAGFVPARIEGVSLPSGGEADELDVVLHPGGSATGILADLDGNPLPGVVIAALTGRESSRAELGRVEADADSRFTLTGLRPGEFWIRPAGRPAASAAGPFRVAADATEDLGQVRVFAGYGLTGRVAGAPEGADVAVFRDGAEIVRVPVVHERFVVEGLPAGPLDLRAEMAGEPGGAVSARIPLAWEVTIRWDAPTELRGRMLDRDGRPVGAASVRAERDDGTSPRTIDVRDPDGAFVLRLPRGRWRIDATSVADGSGAATDVTMPGDSVRPLLLTLERGATMRGLLAAAEDGHPLEGATVTVVSAGERPGRAVSRSDANGRFALVGVPPGPAAIRVETTDRGIHVLETRAVREMDEIDLGRIDLARGTNVRGEVWLAGGVALRRGDVRFECDAGTVSNARTDEYGRFAVAGLPPGGAVVQVRDDQGGLLRSQRMTIPVTWDEWRLRIDIGAGTLVRGRVIASGLPEAFARVVLRLEGPYVVEVAAMTDTMGNFELPPVPAGWGEIEVSIAGALTGWRRPIVVRGGVDQSERLDLPEVSLVGTVEAADGGLPVLFAVVEMTDPRDGRVVGAAVSREDGTFVMPHLPRGSFEVVASREGFGPATKRPMVHLQYAKQEGPLRLQLLPEGRISVTIRDGNARPVTSAWAAAWPAGVSGPAEGSAVPTAFARADADGRIELRGLSRGGWVVSVGAPGRATRMLGTVRGEEGLRDLGEIVLDRGSMLRVIPFAPRGAPSARADGRLPGVAVGILDAFDTDPRPARRNDDLLRGGDPTWVAGGDGVVEIPGLAPGTYRVFPLGRRDAEIRVRVRPDSVGTIFLPVPLEPPAPADPR